MDIRIGIGGWTFEPWRGSFYPEGLTQKRELEFASRKLTSIEINGTFYGVQKPESFVKWHDETPDDFVFAVKGPGFVSNRKVLAETGEAIERFFASGVMELKDKLGPIEWQFMPSKKFDAADIEAFLQLLPKERDGRPLRHSLEVRNDSFACAEFYDLARRHQVAIVVAGDSKYPEIDQDTAPFVYARIMGTKEDEPLGYAAAELDLWAKRAKAWNKPVFLYLISGAKQRNPAAAMALLAQLTT